MLTVEIPYERQKKYPIFYLQFQLKKERSFLPTLKHGVSTAKILMRSRKGKKRDNLKIRPVGMGLRFTEKEADILHNAADAVKASFQYWARTRLLAAARVEFNNLADWQTYIDQVEAEDENQDPVQSPDAE